MSAEPSDRELEVFLAVCRLDSEKCAATELGLSYSTVHHHVQAVYRKEGVASRLAATIALRWTTLPDEDGLIERVATGS
jgi:DNA-binding NarL/FixJ family response regulator